MRSKNEVLCATAGRLAAERSEADIYYFIFNHNKIIKRTPLERNFSDLNY
jgi:hypothetical protein